MEANYKTEMLDCIGRIKRHPSFTKLSHEAIEYTNGIIRYYYSDDSYFTIAHNGMEINIDGNIEPIGGTGIDNVVGYDFDKWFEEVNDIIEEPNIIIIDGQKFQLVEIKEG